MNPYILTVQLSNALSSRLADATNFFAVEIGSQVNSKTTNVLQAIDEITVTYSVGDDLQTVINSKSLNRYNQGMFYVKSQSEYDKS